MTANPAVIDDDELTLRIAEGCLGMTKPLDQTTQQALGFIEQQSPDGYAGFRRAALRAASYIADCINAEFPGKAEIKVIPNMSRSTQ